MPKKKTPALAQHKKNLPRTAYSKENPSPYAFKPGHSGNPSGKSPMEAHLLSKKTLARLNERAPAAWCKSAGLPLTSSKAECLAEWGENTAARLLQQGDLDGLRWLASITEPKGGTSVNVGVAIGAGGDAAQLQGPAMRVFFIESDGNGGISPETQAKITAIEALRDAGVEDVPPYLALEVPYDSKTGIGYEVDSAIVENDGGPIIEGVLGPDN